MTNRVSTLISREEYFNCIKSTDGLGVDVLQFREDNNICYTVIRPDGKVELIFEDEQSLLMFKLTK